MPFINDVTRMVGNTPLIKLKQASEITNFIFDNKEVVNKDELKKIKKRRPRKKKHQDI